MRKYVSLLMMLSHLAHADVSGDLDRFVSGLNLASNTTSVQAFNSQAAGFFGGGSLYARTPVRQYSLVTLDMPDYRAGCAGIDLFTGSLSYISGDKLTNLGKQIMTNGGAYAVDVMLATTVPELKQVRDFLQSTVQKVNQSSINSCEMSQNLVGGLWPKTVASQQKVCNDQRRLGKSGLGHDYVAAHMACAGDAFESSIEEASHDKKRQKEVLMNKNLVWSLLQENAFLNKDTHLSELMMSLTGTLIIDKNGQVTEVPALHSATLIQTLLMGNQSAMLWYCDEEKACLQVSEKQFTLKESDSLSGRVYQLIESINQKLKSDEALSEEEKGFLEMTSLPVMKFLMVLNSTNYGNAVVDMQSYATLIASDLLEHYLNQLLQSFESTIEASPIHTAMLKSLKARIHTAQVHIAKLEPHVNRKLMEKLSLIEHVARIEKQLASNIQAGHL